jgi:protein-tyrosine phosphatase
VSEAVSDGLTDLHTHILPGIDDGAESMSESLDMARLAVDGGVSRAVATPHYLAWPYRDDGASSMAQRVEKSVDSLNQALVSAGIRLRVQSGAECRLDPSLLEALERGDALPLGGTRYVLVELPPYEVPAFAGQLLFQLQIRGYRPILAHPERNPAIVDRPGLLADMAERGILAQVTASSLGGAFGQQARKTALALLKQGTAQIIASDMHHSDGWGLSLSEAAHRAVREVGEGAWAMVTSIPAMILADEPLETVREHAARSVRGGK